MEGDDKMKFVNLVVYKYDVCDDKMMYLFQTIYISIIFYMVSKCIVFKFRFIKTICIKDWCNNINN